MQTVGEAAWRLTLDLAQDLDYFGHPFCCTSSRGTSCTLPAPPGMSAPFGTSQISTRRFFAFSSVLDTASVFFSFVLVSQNVDLNSSVCCAPTQDTFTRLSSMSLQVSPLPLRNATAFSTRSRSRVVFFFPRIAGFSLGSTWPIKSTS